MASTWVESVGHGLAQALDLLAAAVRDCTDDLWVTPMWPVPAPEAGRPLLGPGGAFVTDSAQRSALVQRWATPWGVAWHALECFDYDLAGEFGPWSPPEPFAGHPHWRDLTILAVAWSRSEILEYVDYCRQQAATAMAEMTDAGAARPLPPAHRYGGQPHARVIMGLVGHTTEHASQIRQFITAAGAAPDA
jgi:hypothetical protein